MLANMSGMFVITALALAVHVICFRSIRRCDFKRAMLITRPCNPFRLSNPKRAVQSRFINILQMPHFVISGHQLRFRGSRLGGHLGLRHHNIFIRYSDTYYIQNAPFVNRQFLSYDYARFGNESP